MSITKTSFGRLPDGREADLYILKNVAGASVEITNYGGLLRAINVPDRNGELGNVLLGYKDVSGYEPCCGYIGALIGRVGNRIGKGECTVEGLQLHLAKNEGGKNHLHGGNLGFNRKFWDATPVEGICEDSLILKLVSPDGEEGYPGTLKVMVTYTWTDENELIIRYEAVSDKDTLCNLTNHSYFNLSGDLSTDILSHEVSINADAFTPIDSTFMTRGEIRPVDGSAFDFCTPKPVGRDINADDIQLRNGLGYDHNFVLNTAGDSTLVAASVFSPASGITMEVLTDEPGLQFYVGNFLDGSVKGKNGIAYPYRGAIVMETQHFPNSPNVPSYPSVIVTPDTPYHSTCIYRFKN